MLNWSSIRNRYEPSGQAAKELHHRYEISDEQWEQIKGMFPSYKTGRPSKLSDRTMFNAILWIARSGAPGVIYRKNVTVHGKRPTVVSANGETQDYLSPSSKRFT